MNPIYTRGQLDPDSRNDGPLRFILSTPGQKRDGMELDNRKFRLENFNRNPVMLWAHGFSQRGDLPIGLWRNVTVTRTDELVGEAEFDAADEFAREIERKYRDGYLSATSISWLFGEDNAGRYQDLLEVSAVAVPADPDALVAGRRVTLTTEEFNDLQARLDTLERAVQHERARAATINALKSL